MSPYITIGTPAGTFRAYIARPAVLPAPVVVVIQEIFGVNLDLRDTCDELADKGYLALSPDLFWRMEPAVDMSDQTDAEWKRGFALYTAFDYDAGVSDIVATMNVGRSMTGSSGKVGLMGFCLGGLMTFMTTIRNGSDASVVYYGGGTDKHLDGADRMSAPMLMHLAQEDEYIPADVQRAIVTALQHNPGVQVFTYAGCKHAFARRGGAHYDQTAALLANGRTSDFFALHLR